MSKSLKFPLNKLVEVEWTDACGKSRWDDLEEYQEMTPMPCKSVGYIARKDDFSIALVQTQSIDEQATGGISIPTAWINKIRKLQ